MGKITDALKKAAEDRFERIDKINKIKEHRQIVIKKKGDSRMDSRIVTYFDPKALISEQFKILRTNVLSSQKGKALKVLVITSSIHQEGKTVTSLNLGVTLAQSTKKPRVLLIDADMRRGRLAKYLGVDQPAGLSEVLVGQAEANQVMFNVDIDNLTFMTSGAVPHNPVELLDSDVMAGLIENLKKQFDHIIIDTPPIISVTDAGIVGAQADGVLMVIQAGRTQRGIVRRAIELLHQSHARILGHVLTNVEYHLPEYIYRYL